VIVATLLPLTACGGDKPASRSEASTPTASQISWKKEQSLLKGCKAKAVEQAHSRLVTLTLRDGSEVYAYEPRLDLVVHELPRLTGRCGPITLAME
jgi:hypothetical protein